jgi:hypothetical protein
LYNAAQSNANYWVNLVNDLTGKNIEYDVTKDQWRDTDSGRFTYNPAVDIMLEEYQLEQYIINLYS